MANAVAIAQSLAWRAGIRQWKNRGDGCRVERTQGASWRTLARPPEEVGLAQARALVPDPGMPEIALPRRVRAQPPHH
jgi:hypothetical protein